MNKKRREEEEEEGGGGGGGGERRNKRKKKKRIERGHLQELQFIRLVPNDLYAIFSSGYRMSPNCP